MHRRFNHLVRCVKITTPQGVVDGWWCYAKTAEKWVYIEEDQLQWILDFLPELHRPSIEEIRAEAYSDIAYNADEDRPFFVDRKITESLPVFTEDEINDNRIPPKERDLPDFLK